MRKGFLILILALSFLFTTANANELPENCMDRNIFIANLTKMGFTLDGRGLQKNGTVLELYTHDGGTFIILVLHPNIPPKMPAIIACEVSRGELWFGYKPNLNKYKKS
jgi:hypothetical protein